MNRRRFVACFSAGGLGSTLLPGALAAVADDAETITIEMVQAAQSIAGLSFTRAQQQTIVERLNGGSRHGENERAADLCDQRGYRGVGSSDAHLASHIGACLTDFQATIRNESELVEALLSGRFHPVWLEDTRNGATG